MAEFSSYVCFEALTALLMKIRPFCCVTLRWSVVCYWRSEELTASIFRADFDKLLLNTASYPRRLPGTVYVGFEVVTALNMKIAVWDVTLGSLLWNVFRW